jgi:Type IV secretion system pilin
MKTALLSFLATLSILLAPISLALAYDPFPNVCNGDASDSTICQQKAQEQNPVAKTINDIATVVAFFAALAAIFFIMLGGFRFITSNGDPAKAASGRMTVLYAVIGLIVIIAARSIVGFIVGRIYA